MNAAGKARRANLMRGLVIAVVILAALLLGVGGLTIASPLSSQPAAYLADRNIGLAILLLVLLAIKWTRALAAVLLTTAIIHVVDAIADVYFRSPAAVVGSLVIAILSILAACWLLRQQGASS